MPFSECLVDGIPECLRVPAISDEGGISLLSIIISKGNSILKVKVLEGGMEGGMREEWRVSWSLGVRGFMGCSL